MDADILTSLWLGFMVAMFAVVLYGIRRLSRRQRMAKGEI
jgi:flagellar biogenesis protein FliO